MTFKTILRAENKLLQNEIERMWKRCPVCAASCKMKTGKCCESCDKPARARCRQFNDAQTVYRRSIASIQIEVARELRLNG